MEKKSQLQSTYNSARSNMLIMLILTAVNVVLTLVEADVMFMFTAYFPYIAAVYAMEGMFAFIRPVIIIVGILLPLAATLLCWFVTGKGKYRWMNIAAIIFALDTVFMFSMFINLGFQADLITDYIVGTLFHVYILWALFKGAVAGKKLQKGEYVDDTNEVVTVGSDADAVAVADGADKAIVPTVKKYVYNKEYAKANGAEKTKTALLTVLGYIAAVFLSLAAIAVIPDSAVGGLVFLLAFFGALIVMIVVLSKIAPFTSAQMTTYTAEADGKLSCATNQGITFTNIDFNDMRILETCEDRWVVEYTDAKGRTKKMTIPNAYPGLAEYMNGVK